jgi:glutamate formiminotransferase/formiminotetrahydrofolate cyclodeaminase
LVDSLGIRYDCQILPTNGIWNTTLENFGESVASSEPTPAGVSVAAVSAALGATLLQKVLKIVAKRKSFTGDLEKLSSLREAARKEAGRLTQYANEDIAAYRGYIEARRNKTTDVELGRSLREVMETPLNGARAALSGLNLCVDAAEIVNGSVAADLATAAILLESAVRSMLLCVEMNLRDLPDREVAAECKEIEEKALRQLASVLRKVSIRSARS